MNLKQSHTLARQVAKSLGGKRFRVSRPGTMVIMGVERFSVTHALDLLPKVAPYATETLVGPSRPSAQTMAQLEQHSEDCRRQGKRLIWVSGRHHTSHVDTVCVWNPKNGTLAIRVWEHQSLYWWFWWSTWTRWKNQWDDWQDRRIKKRLSHR